jgi:hypothetical protein
MKNRMLQILLADIRVTRKIIVDNNVLITVRWRYSEAILSKIGQY